MSKENNQTMFRDNSYKIIHWTLYKYPTYTYTHTTKHKNINYYNYFTDRDSNTEWNIQ